jgi:DNA polymerase-3 subunit gamma/tau
VAEGLATIDRILSAGRDAGRLIEDLISYARDLLVYQAAPKLMDEAEMALMDENFTTLAGNLATNWLYRVVDLLSSTQQQLKTTNQPDLYLQVATVRLAQLAKTPEAPTAMAATASAPADEDELTQLREQVSKLSQTVQELERRPQGGVNQASPAKPARSRQPKPSAKAKVNTAAIYPILAHATRDDLNALKDVWPDVLNRLSTIKRSMMNVSEPVAASRDGVIVSFDNDFYIERVTGDATLLLEMRDGLKAMTGRDEKVVLVEQSQWPHVRQNFIKEVGFKAKPEAAKDGAAAATSAAVAPQAAQEAPTAPTDSAPAAADTATEAPKPDTADTKVVSELTDLFGKDNVDVVDD